MKKQSNEALGEIITNLTQVVDKLSENQPKAEFSSDIGNVYPFKLIWKYEQWLKKEFIHGAYVQTLAFELPSSLKAIIGDYLIISRYHFDAEYMTAAQELISTVGLDYESSLSDLFDQIEMKHKANVAIMQHQIQDYFDEYPEAKNPA